MRSNPFSVLSKALIAASFMAGALAHAQDVSKAEVLKPEIVAIGQSLADHLRSAAGTDLALVASGHIKEKADGSSLVDALLYPTDEIVVLTLTGKQLRQAFERSLVFFPAPNASFLYFSGADVSFKPGEPANERVASVLIASLPADSNRSYTVAMPASLGRGGLGYFKIWDSKNITKTLPDNMEKVLTGKSVTSTVSRWQSKG